ncbi:CGLD27 family protein [Coleofasciculus sp. LEGE 07092]|uniref:CGLD27 family protein n=2 Tax=unclassified Coleofasciculus TaxID=2692782 RepID=UPI00187EABA2|nr:CGLD27 family protein [Coleofasciculus sp. LEGE 07092]MBE9125092.1 CGLD27 family protein [Coleofasciculus sp. LEGE 07081]MBE9150095.1 CGLD27 family protein [Coleofasciculus sp. LEGE 07092]
MESSVSICPVPTEQQPVNEYQQLADSYFFGWVRRDLRSYVTKLACVWGLSWLIAGPVAAASFAPQKHLVQFILAGGAGALVFVMLILLRLYLGWSYVSDRLFRKTISYEESGWYDGQTWTKPSEVVTRDRLIVSYQVQPLLQRLKWTFGVIVLFVISGSLIWNFL